MSNQLINEITQIVSHARKNGRKLKLSDFSKEHQDIIRAECAKNKKAFTVRVNLKGGDHESKYN